MASLTIRNIDDPLKARHGRSMEEDVRQILRAVLETAPGTPHNSADRIRARFEPLGGVDLDIDWLREEKLRDPPAFD